MEDFLAYFAALPLKFVNLVKTGTLPVVVPLMITCTVIGIATFDRVKYLYGIRRLLFGWLPGPRARRQALEADLHDALDEFVEKPTPQLRAEIVERAMELGTAPARFLESVFRSAEVLESGPHRQLAIARYQYEHEAAIEKRMQILSTFAKAAPLMGLLGTVTGMIATFRAMMVASTSDPRALASGVSIALTATFVGLSVSLPGVIAMGLLSKRGLNQQEEVGVLARFIASGSGPKRVEEKGA